MGKEIKLKESTKTELRSKLTSVDQLITKNVKELSNLMLEVNQLEGNPEIYNILNMMEQITANKMTLNKTLQDFSNKMDLNLQQIIDLDKEVSSKIKGW